MPINYQHSIYKLARITPLKIGQFVSIWKRNEAGITVPFDFSDPFELMIIEVKKDSLSGLFVFDKEILVKRNIISVNGIGGKRGMRVYPPWDVPENKQATASQQWQLAFFKTQ